MTPGRRAALKKAQLASARKRRGKGKKSSTKRRVIATAGVLATLGGGAYVYKNREKLIVAPLAERAAMSIAYGKKGSPLTRAERHQVRMAERRNHASRSTFRTREYLKARNYAIKAYRAGYTINPRSKNTIWDSTIHPSEQSRHFKMYRRDVNTRAVHRLNRIKGRKVKGFDYTSGKVRFVTDKGRVMRLPI